MTISLCFAFVVLVLSTHNIYMAISAIISIGGIVVSVVSVMEMSGWELGIAESMTIVILIGLSVDYVVHLANHYVECVNPDRHYRMKVALRDIGISIISGAFTTMGAGVFLAFGTVIVFNKFAILIISTICFSLVFSLLFFASLMHLCGPIGKNGDIIVLMQKCCNKNKKLESS